jgi:hypothetical protein
MSANILQPMLGDPLAVVGRREQLNNPMIKNLLRVEHPRAKSRYHCTRGLGWQPVLEGTDRIASRYARIVATGLP